MLERIAARTLPKGDVLAVAQVAGIMAAKHTPDIVPLCHPLPLTKVDVLLELEADGVVVTASAETTAQTGVEMEALTAVMAAALTVYDMTKGLDPSISIASAELIEKTGGKSGHWRRDAAMRSSVLTVSRRGQRRRARRQKRRGAGRAARRESGFELVERRVVPDERDAIAAALRELAAAADLVVTTGGTGFAPRDVTPEATADVVERPTPGLDEAMRAFSIGISPHGMLARGRSGIVGRHVDREHARQPTRLRRVLRRDRPGAGPRARPAGRQTDRPLTATAVYARRFASLVKIEHSVFALPYAYSAAILAEGGIPPFATLFWITVAMVGARSLAMALNRLIDAEIDARNPRTARREIPVGAAQPRPGAGLRGRLAGGVPDRGVAAAVADPRAVADPGDRICDLPVPEAVHLDLPLLPGGGRRAGAAGRLDRGHQPPRPRSVPAGRARLRCGSRASTSSTRPWISRSTVLRDSTRCRCVSAWGGRLLITRAAHLISVVLLVWLGLSMGLGPLYYLGVAVIAGLLTYENAIVSEDDLSRVDMAFLTMNGVIAIVFLAGVLLDAIV